MTLTEGFPKWNWSVYRVTHWPSVSRLSLSRTAFLWALLRLVRGRASCLARACILHRPPTSHRTPTRVGSVGVVVDTEASDARQRRAESRHALRRAGAVQSGAGGWKTDFPDAERMVKRWVAQALTLGFVPDAERRLWRTVMSQVPAHARPRPAPRPTGTSAGGSAYQRLQRGLGPAWTSARRMGQALADRETHPATLAALADPR